MELVISPVEEDVTNGDVLVEICFPNAELKYQNGCFGIVHDGCTYWYNEDWWNAPYRNRQHVTLDITKIIKHKSDFSDL